jgi:hypothetical protein
MKDKHIVLTDVAIYQKQSFYFAFPIVSSSCSVRIAFLASTILLYQQVISSCTIDFAAELKVREKLYEKPQALQHYPGIWKLIPIESCC